MMMNKEINTISPRLLRDQLVTIGDLESFKEELILALARLIKPSTEKPEKKWIKSYEVKQLLGISNTTLQTFRCNGTLPFTKIGNLIFYDMEDIVNLMNKEKRRLGKNELPPRIVSFSKVPRKNG